MKKTGRVLLFIAIFALLFSGTANAQASLGTEEFYELYENLDEEIRQVLEQLGATPSKLFNGEGFSLQSVWQWVVSFVGGSVKVPIKTLGTVTAVLLFCLLFQNLCPTKNGGMNAPLQFFVGFCITVALVVPASGTLTKTVGALVGAGAFMKVFTPVYAGVLLVMGKALTVNGAGALMFGYCQVMTYLSQNIILPFVSMFWSFAVCEAVGGGVRVSGFATCVKRIAMWVMGISATAFSGVICLTGVLSGAGDSVAQRTTRFFIGNMIPVIGGALSDSMATLQGCFSLLRSGGGVFGVIVLLVFLLPVLTEVVLWRLSVMVMVAISGILELPRVTALLQAVGEGVGLLLGIVLSGFAVSVVSLSVLMLAGG
jgi:stage III sporulation protein AE